MNKLTALTFALALATALALPSLAGAETTSPPAAPQGMAQGDAMMGGDRTGGGTGMTMMDMMKMMGGGQTDGVASGMMGMSDMSQMMQMQLQMMQLQQMMQMTRMMMKCQQMMMGMADHPDMQMKPGTMPPKG